jgi:hypothetical protein
MIGNVLKELEFLDNEIDDIISHSLKFFDEIQIVERKIDENAKTKLFWSSLNENQEKIKDDLILKYKNWYNTGLRIISEYFPSDIKNFKENFDPDDDYVIHPMILDYFNFKIRGEGNNKEEFLEDFKIEFQEILFNQKKIIEDTKRVILNRPEFNKVEVPEVFIGWAGESSEEVALKFVEWLPKIFPNIKPFYSSDIEKGSDWLQSLLEKLKKCVFGIVIVTPETLDNNWLYFEIGALSQNINKKKVVPILFGLEKSDVRKPLNIFQNAKFGGKDTKKEIFKVLKSLNNTLSSYKIDKELLKKRFNTEWKSFYTSIYNITKKLDNNLKKSNKEENQSEHFFLIQKNCQILFNILINTIEKLYIGLGYFEIDPTKFDPYEEYMKYLGISKTKTYGIYNILEKFTLRINIPYDPTKKTTDFLPPIRNISNPKEDFENPFLDEKRRLDLYHNITKHVKDEWDLNIFIDESKYPSINQHINNILNKIIQSIELNSSQDLNEVFSNKYKMLLLKNHFNIYETEKPEKYFNLDREIKIINFRILFDPTFFNILDYEANPKRAYDSKNKPKSEIDIRDSLLKYIRSLKNGLNLKKN